MTGENNEMNLDWPVVELGDLVQIKHGWPFRGQFLNETDQADPLVVSIGNFDYDGGFRFSSTKTNEYLSDYPEKYKLNPGDILLIMTCQTPGGEILGIPGKIPDDGIVYLHNQRLGKVIIKDTESVNTDFLYSLFLTREFNYHLYSTASGSKILHTSPKRIESFKFRLPPPEVMEFISQISNHFIELGSRISQSANRLNEMIEEIYRSWFIDFDPVKAKAEGKLPYGMDKETSALFPDSFEDSKNGFIPSGWRSIEISKISLCNDGDWIEMKDQGGSDYRLVQPSNIGLGRFVETGNFRYITEETFQRLNCIQIEPSDVLVARMPDPKGNVGRAYLWPQDVPKAITSVDVCIIRVDKNQVTPKYLELYLNSYDSLERSKSFMTGTTHPRIRRKDIETFRVIVPPISILEQFEKRVQAMSEFRDLVVKQEASLSTTRDALLPRLMSGELSVS